MTSLRIQERFVSVQGEGALVGAPSSFVRVSGCNLRCVWCDTPRTSWAPEGRAVELDELVRWCAAGPRHVVLTGGEPMLLSPAAELSQRLRSAGHHLTVETAGTVWCEGLEADLISISPKLSHSTPWDRAAALGKPKLATMHEAARLDLELLARLIERFADGWQLKFVVRTRAPELLTADLDEIDAIVTALELPTSARDRVLLMPEGTDDATLRAGYLAAIDACRTRGYRLGLRLHIHLFGHTPGT
ncbi:7-carboxy-7-deazaguanine synthase [Enhygromyxa salina]|uniref:7-carboxy-7-deazaguanine synthase n=1 Tax=Enhygromyxa salina TaxID=215803 RepID=A0A2S9XCM4_9BACT|nr:7-carboxy-7-deazaguanine synthase QueE [Enhygromyxa salina]PRP90608.1 7-carboxy-7-deazaguanine synthase [Enhygromyxa salina]